MPVLWGVAPPPKLPRSWIRLVAPPAGGRLVLARLGPIVGVMTHWVHPRTLACSGEESCPHHDSPQTWKGFMPCVVPNTAVVNGRCTWREAVAVITEGVAEDVETLPLGFPFFLNRSGSKKNAPLTVEQTRFPKIEPVPASFDVKPYVLRAMNWPGEFACQLKLAR